MRRRLVVLALSMVLLASAGCATQPCSIERPIPGMSDSRHVEQIID